MGESIVTIHETSGKGLVWTACRRAVIIIVMKFDEGIYQIALEDWLYQQDFQKHFDSPQPLEVDLGAGKGRFILARAGKQPEINFLGIERKLVRVRKIEKKAFRNDTHNIRLLRLEGQYCVQYLFPDASVDTYYIFYPDPWPKAKHHKNRLMKASFVDQLHRTLKTDGKIHFSSDHLPYYDEVKALMDADQRFTPIDPFIPTEDETTDFELLFAGKIPGRCSYQKR